MIREALEYIALRLAVATRFELPDGAAFDKPVHRPPLPTAPPLAAALTFATLRGLADYVRHTPDGASADTNLLHVVSPARVELVSKLEDFHRRREVEAVALYESPASGVLDHWMSLEDATISLMALFTPAGNRDTVLATLKAISTENAEIREDDGMGQTVTTKAGVHLRGTERTVNPVSLAPFRCFPEEVEQPESLFILRLRDGGRGVEVLLKTGDGSGWKVPAAKAVADALAGYLEGIVSAPKILY